ncbi:MAG: stage II sporulation protein M [Rhodocyclaceae bacterium]|nr:stage II sporulation protein M [Rhodocyclaceae bacterium]MCA3082488.1 stage II sporulation protein M [Rhodocyclaceae bacterium]
MRQDAFEARYSGQWVEFENWLLVEAGGKQVAGQAVFHASELPYRYRQLARHLALARDRQYSAELGARLEALVLAGHQALYGASHSAESSGVLRFIRATFPQLVRSHWRSVLIASLCLFVPMIVLTVLIPFVPEFAYVMMPAEQLAKVQQMYDPANRVLGEAREAGSDVAMWGYYIWNNVRIDFQCFAGGLLFGVGSIFFLIFNGGVIGTIAGHLTQLGYIETFWGFVAGHSALELVGAALSGAAGLQLGYALIAPGRRTRLDALKMASHDAAHILYGAAAMTFMAAFIEAFWSASRVPPVEVKYAFGIACWVLVIAYFCFAGRSRRSAISMMSTQGPQELKHAP